MSRQFEIVMGLEVHVELATKTKIFCGCSTEFGGEPNSHVCPVCMGLPGSLPVLNKSVVDYAMKAGLALNCNITRENRFDRKNYFYPDLPKDYQISQLYFPICRDGALEFEAGGETARIRIHEIHMEEDAGKLVHDAAGTLVDYNRCGVPLIEIVTEPDFRSADQVIGFLENLQQILKYLGVSDCKMQEGSMRADVNLSVRPVGQEEFGTRTEMKNINSLKAIRRAIEFESQRQINLIEAGGKVTQETRRWNDEEGESTAMRSKENAQDYRYFPDPDLLPVSIDDAWYNAALNSLPELPQAKRQRYVAELGLSADKAAVITSAKELAVLFEEIVSCGQDVNEAANVVTGDILKLMKEAGQAPEELKIDSAKVASAIGLVTSGKISRKSEKEIIEAIFKADVDPESYAKEHNMIVVEDLALIAETADRVVASYPASIADYKNGKAKAMDFLVGMCMRELKGKARPETISAILKEKVDAAPMPEGFENAAPVKDKKAKKEEKRAKEAAEKALAEAKAQEEAEKALAEAEEAAREAKAEEARRAKEAAEKRKAALDDVNFAPIEINNRYRNRTCADIGLADIDQEVRLSGWIATIRNHGGIVFVDLRDHYGVTQVVVTDEMIADLGKETVICVEGTVIKRDPDTVNPNIPTGEVELKARTLEVLGHSHKNLPFEIERSTETKEDVRLKYRFLDLRNPKVHNNIILRSQIIRFLRKQMEALGFLEIQTPILANSSPEGARDYLVPSRKHKGKFYALPQAPQQFKQMLMASGFDKYFQIAPCFRDEDARQDRSPGEFYQLDFELAFATQEDVFAVAEKVLYETFCTFSDKEVSKPPFVRIPFAEAMLKYGTDKPDLRNPLIIQDLSDFFANVDFAPFRGKIVRAIVVPGMATKSKSFFGSMEKFATGIGMKGLGYISVKEDMTYKG
ncbi:MAG: Asp-tRNA(Asn)/Glu-tRNA(Gln) amidotransferase subunit GatB, partial [Firmicutes bacterium]|nr:Asp-tRNA(Asn)/Glu-tRNA(Gln) amidotransferase subunit GatB [Bacillota bacterium]